MEYPFKQTNNNDGSFNRTFKPNVDFDDLQWHFDEEDRIVKPLNENDWKIQFDNQLPMPINQEIFIPKNVYHRVIKGTSELNVNITEVHWDSGLGKWLKEKWVDISRKDKSGKHPACGASSDKGSREKDPKKAYPKCRPAKKAAAMSKKEKKRATEQKRRVERKTTHHKGRKPNWVSHLKEDFSFKTFLEYIDPPPKPDVVMVQKQEQTKENIEVKLDKNLKIAESGYAISGTIIIRDRFGLNNTILYRKINEEINKRIVLVKRTDDFDKPTEVHVFDKSINNVIKNVYFEKISDCDIEIFGQTIKFSEFIKDKKVSDKVLDIINNFDKFKNKEGLIEIKFNFIMPTFKA